MVPLCLLLLLEWRTFKKPLASSRHVTWRIKGAYFYLDIWQICIDFLVWRWIRIKRKVTIPRVADWSECLALNTLSISRIFRVHIPQQEFVKFNNLDNSEYKRKNKQVLGTVGRNLGSRKSWQTNTHFGGQWIEPKLSSSPSRLHSSSSSHTTSLSTFFFTLSFGLSVHS